MSIYLKQSSKRILVAVLSLALIFGLAPMLPVNSAYAEDEDTVLTVEFRTGNQVTDTQDYTQAELEEMASDEVADENYLAWDGDKYVVLNSNSGISALDLVKLESLPSGWTLEVTNGNDTQSFGYQDVQNGKFFGDTTPTTGIETNATSNTPILSLETGQADVTETAAKTEVTSYEDKAPRFLIGLQTKGKKEARDYATYIQEENDISRYVSGVTKISVVKPGPIDSFSVYTQVGKDGEKKLAKTFTGKELDSLAHRDIRGFLQSGSTWSVHATNKYIPAEELVSEAGVIFNEEDTLVPMAGDGFSTSQTYEALEANKYFYGGTTGTGTDTGNPSEVGSVLAINWKGSDAISTGTARTILNAMDWSNPNTTGRFYMGVSEENYLQGAAAGNRLITAPVEMTIIKDVADPISKAKITLSKTSYTATGKQIKPKVTVKYGDITLKSGTDYTVKYGTNKLGKGTVKITGKGNFTGTVTKTITIKPRATTLKSVKAGKKKATVKWKKSKDAVSGYQIAYKVKGAKKYKLVTVKGQKKVAKTFTKLKKGKRYTFKVRTYKIDNNKTYYSKYSKVKTTGKIK